MDTGGALKVSSETIVFFLPTEKEFQELFEKEEKSLEFMKYLMILPIMRMKLLIL